MQRFYFQEYRCDSDTNPTLSFILCPLSFSVYLYPMIRFIFSFPQWSRVLLSLIYLGLIAMLSLLPSDDLPKVQLFKGFDKLVHGCMYFGLTILACWTFHSEEKRIRILFVVLFSITWGLLMEISQLEMMIGRAFEWTDELSNCLGSVMGALVYVWIAGSYRRGRGVKTTR